MNEVLIRKPFVGRERCPTVIEGPSMTKREMAKACDIHTILAKYEKTGMVDHVNRYQGQYADVTGNLDLQDALNAVRGAQDAFDSLPAKVRRRFNNDPVGFLEFVHDPSNEDEMRELGLLKSERGRGQTLPRDEQIGEPADAGDSPEGAE